MSAPLPVNVPPAHIPPPVLGQDDVRLGRDRDHDANRERDLLERKEGRITRLFQQQFRMAAASCYMNKIATIVNKEEAEVLATEIQDLLKKYLSPRRLGRHSLNRSDCCG